MLLWLSLSVGAALCAMVIAVTLFRAERRARHALYAALGVNDDLIPALMSQKGPVSAQMALVRQAGLTAPTARPEEIRGRADGLQAPAQRAFRFTRALNSARGPGRERPTVAPTRSSSPLDRRES